MSQGTKELLMFREISDMAPKNSETQRNDFRWPCTDKRDGLNHGFKVGQDFGHPQYGSKRPFSDSGFPR